VAELILIDLSGIWWASWHATVDQEVSAAYESTLTTVRRLAHGYEYVAICMDAPPYFRKQLSAAYKAQRDVPAPQAVEQFARVKRRLAADGFLLWSAESFEADDVIATAVVHAVRDRMPVTIASGDKDMLQLVDDSAAVRQIKPSDGTVFGAKEVREKFGVPPWQMRDWLALVGDTSDNIPGVPGVGAKTAAKLLHDFGDIDALLRGLDTLPPSKVRTSIMDNVAQLELARKLVTLREDAPINWQEIYQERTPERLTEDEDMGDIDETDDIGESEDAPPAEIVERTEEPKREKQEALAVHSNGGTGVQAFEQGLQPGSLGAAYKLARGLYESRIYSRFPNAEAIWAIIIRGREMGLGALTALDTFHLVEGRPSPHAHLLVSRAKQHPDCEYFCFLGGDETYAEYETRNRRNPNPTRLKYTIEQAKKAELVRPTKSGKPSNWQTRPAEMLRKTCAVQLARVEYPEALLGAYAVEELE
jgi:5'-3' exonuclease